MPQPLRPTLDIPSRTSPRPVDELAARDLARMTDVRNYLSLLVAHHHCSVEVAP